MNSQPSRANWRKRLFAYMMANSKEYESLMTDRKRALLRDLHGDVLEIGAGTATNLAYLARDVRWFGIDPNPAMFQYAQREAQKRGVTIDLREASAERLPYSDSSMDAVISTTVLCSVRDPQQALREIVRVLKPGGKFVFIEHVAAPRETSLRRWQGIIRPMWQFFSDGCHTNRETWAIIEHAGFRDVQIEHFRLKYFPVGPHIAGVAIK